MNAASTPVMIFLSFILFSFSNSTEAVCFYKRTLERIFKSSIKQQNACHRQIIADMHLLFLFQFTLLSYTICQVLSLIMIYVIFNFGSYSLQTTIICLYSTVLITGCFFITIPIIPRTHNIYLSMR